MSKFLATATPIEGLLVIEPTVFGDHRGFFLESYSERDFAEIGINERFVQDNHSKSRRGVLRGMHLQHPHAQGKLVRVAAGAIYDVAVDVRPGSPTRGQWFGVELSAENKRLFWVPAGFAHGFLTLEEGTEMLYKCTDYYHPELESGYLWNDPALAIDWRLPHYGFAESDLLLSDKDRQHPPFIR